MFIFLMMYVFADSMDVATLVQSQKAATQAFHSLSCEMEVEEQNKEVLYKGKGACYRMGDSAKAVEDGLFPGRKIEALAANGITHKITYSNGMAGVAVFDSKIQILNECDAWHYALFYLRRPGKLEPVTLEQLVAACSKVNCNDVNIDKKNMISLSMVYTNPKDESEVWKINILFDQDRNYLISDLKYTSIGSAFTGCILHYCIADYYEIPGGMYFPKRLDYKFTSSGNVVALKKSVVFKNVKCNTALDKSKLSIVYPNGVLVTDGIRGTRYNINTSGHMISKETPIDYDAKPMENISLAQKSNPSKPLKTDSDASMNSMNWLIILSLIILIASLFYLFILFIRRAPQGYHV